MSLVKRGESIDFDVFFLVFLGVWKREKNEERSWEEEKFQKNLSSLSKVCLGLFIASGTKIEATAIVGPLRPFNGRQPQTPL